MSELTVGRFWAAQRRGAMFACVLALLAALGAVLAPGASALGEQCSGSNVKGLGAFLQTQAHERWSSEGEQGFNGSPSILACSGSQGSGGTPEASYVPVGSPAALHAWGADDGVFHAGEFGGPYHFLGTDIAPSGPVGEEKTMLANMKAALGSDVAVLPVAQTAIAIAAHPPRMPAHPACTVPKLTGIQVEKIFSGEIRNWRQLSFASDRTVGGDCDQSITRIVRGESAGTTYQFKHYLNQVNPLPLECTGKEKLTWAQLKEPFGGETPPNVEWPRNAACQEEEGPVTTVSGEVGEGEIGPLSFVAENPGTITYGSLPEAKRLAPKQIVDVHNGATYADPEAAEGSANCAAVEYTLPAEWEAGVNVDWSQVYGSNPSIGKTAKSAYPICTLTWAIAATEKFSEAASTTVRDYLRFAVFKGSQLAIEPLGYQELPAPVADAANAALSHIIGKEEEGGEEEGGGGTGTVLCKVKPEMIEGVLTCPKGQGFTEGKVTGTLYPGKAATFESVAGPELTINCPEGHYLGEFNEDGSSAGGLYEFVFGQLEGCSSTFPEGQEAIVSMLEMPFDQSRFEYGEPEGPTGHQGVFTLAKFGASPLLAIYSAAYCVYMPNTQVFNVYNGSPTLMAVQGTWKLIEGSPEESCPTLLSGYAPMTVARLGEGLPLYLAGK